MTTKQKQLNDQQLLDTWIELQDQRAFTQLVNRHGPMVMATCQRVIQDPNLSEDAFQASFMVLAKKAKGLDGSGPGGLAGWLHRVAYRCASETKRREAIRLKHEGKAKAMFADTPQTPVADPMNNPIIDEELNNLPDKYRLPLLLCYYQGKSREEAAESLGWSLPKLKGALSRGRDQLKSRLLRRGVAAAAVLGSSYWVSAEAMAASMSPTLVTSTVSAAGHIAAGTAISSGLAAGSSYGLAKGVMSTMLATKLKLVGGSAAAVAVVGAMSIFAGTQAFGSSPEPALNDNIQFASSMNVDSMGGMTDQDGKPLTLAGGKWEKENKDWDKDKKDWDKGEHKQPDKPSDSDLRKMTKMRLSARVVKTDVVLSWTPGNKAPSDGLKVVFSKDHKNPTYPHDEFLAWVPGVNQRSTKIPLDKLACGNDVYIRVCAVKAGDHNTMTAVSNVIRIPAVNQEKLAALYKRHGKTYVPQNHEKKDWDKGADKKDWDKGDKKDWDKDKKDWTKDHDKKEWDKDKKDWDKGDKKDWGHKQEKQDRYTDGELRKLQTMKASVKRDGNKITISWNTPTPPSSDGLKIVASTSHGEPTYPQDKFVHWHAGTGLTSTTFDASRVPQGQKFYIRVCAVLTKDHHQFAAVTNVIEMGPINAWGKDKWKKDHDKKDWEDKKKWEHKDKDEDFDGAP